MTMSKELWEFTRQFHGLLETGEYSFVECLSIPAERLHEGDFKQIMIEVTNKVASGYPLHHVMKEYPDTFSPEFVSMIRSGMNEGKLDIVLQDFLNQAT